MNIVTHDGTIHGDEALAGAILQQLHHGTPVQRVSRESEELKNHLESKNSYVIDVGGVYDLSMNNFDHHQASFTEARECGTPYSAAGLIWKHFGKAYIRRIFYGHSDEDVDYGHKFVDDNFIRHVDATDNGGWCFDGYFVMNGRYDGVTFSDMIAAYNPHRPVEDFPYNHLWEPALQLAQDTLLRQVARAMASGEIRSQIQDKIQAAPRVNYGKSLLLHERIRWQEHIDLLGKTLMYVIYPASSDGHWSVQAVPTRPEGFQPRKPFPEKWAGLRDDDLIIATGVPESVFCHKNRHLAVAKTQQAAISLTQLALDA